MAPGMPLPLVVDRRPWGAFAALALGGLAVAALLGVSTPPAYPFGDVAIIEATTAAALRQPIALGPYSQFGWHHPGPMMFYLLAPFYAAAGAKSIGLAVGAVVLNLLALGVMWRTLWRHAGHVVAAVVTLVLALFLQRGGELATSIWNPHLIVLPLVAFMVLCAAGSLGDGAALVAAVVFASFVAQASVSVVPATLAVTAFAVILGWAGSDGMPSSRHRLRREWLGWAALVGVVLWLPPLVEQATAQPGNLTKLLRFFVSDPSRGQSWRDAVLTWGDMITTTVRPSLELPWGKTFAHRGSWGMTAVALTQLTLLGLLTAWASRTGRQALARLSLLTVLASVVACWSVTRIAGDIADYQIFWMSGIGALSVALIAAAIADRATAGAPGRRQWLLATTSVLLGTVMVALTVRGLAEVRGYAVNQRSQESPRRIVAEGTAAYLARERVVRPLFRMNSTSWLQAAAVVLHAYRQHRDVAVDSSWVPVFGQALAPNGSEDLVLEIGGGCPANATVVASADGLCVYRGDARP